MRKIVLNYKMVTDVVQHFKMELGLTMGTGFGQVVLPLVVKRDSVDQIVTSRNWLLLVMFAESVV